MTLTHPYATCLPLNHCLPVPLGHCEGKKTYVYTVNTPHDGQSSIIFTAYLEIMLVSIVTRIPDSNRNMWWNLTWTLPKNCFGRRFSTDPFWLLGCSWFCVSKSKCLPIIADPHYYRMVPPSYKLVYKPH